MYRSPSTLLQAIFVVPIQKAKRCSWQAASLSFFLRTGVNEIKVTSPIRNAPANSVQRITLTGTEDISLAATTHLVNMCLSFITTNKRNKMKH